jgi:hypothetical protein
MARWCCKATARGSPRRTTVVEDLVRSPEQVRSGRGVLRHRPAQQPAREPRWDGPLGGRSVPVADDVHDPDSGLLQQLGHRLAQHLGHGVAGACRAGVDV